MYAFQSQEFILRHSLTQVGLTTVNQDAKNQSLEIISWDYLGQCCCDCEQRRWDCDLTHTFDAKQRKFDKLSMSIST